MNPRLLALRHPALWLPLLAALCLAPPSAALTIDWVPIANPGNAADTPAGNCYSAGCGSVGYAYFIAKHEVTNADYAEFLNAVADTDANSVWHPFMAIQRGGASGSYNYVVNSGFGARPVVYVSYYDALRYANWLHNGQPNTGSQTAATTEAGSYTFSGPTTVGARNGGATVVLPSENEWYKAAYYDALSASYFDYPTASNTAPTCTTPTATANRANCNTTGGNIVTDVGAYTGSASPYHTFDQGGNVSEWNEVLFGANRGTRGGNFNFAVSWLAAATPGSAPPSTESNLLGFRVANLVPEPGSALLLGAGLAMLGARRRRRR